MAYKPKSGFAWNPLLKYPRNLTCFCGSARKAKVCCMLRMSHTVKVEDLPELEHFMNYVNEGMNPKKVIQLVNTKAEQEAAP